MKSKFILVTSLALGLTGVAHAQAPADIYTQAYNQLVNQYCTGNSVQIDATSADQIAQSAMQGTTNPTVVLDVFTSTCNWDIATQAGQLSVTNQFDENVFNSLFGQYCSGNSVQIDATSALSVTQSVAQGTSNAAIVLSVFQQSCSWNSAVSAGQLATGNQFDANTYNMLFAHFKSQAKLHSERLIRT
jgi:hypothetical protein